MKRVFATIVMAGALIVGGCSTQPKKIYVPVKTTCPTVPTDDWQTPKITIDYTVKGDMITMRVVDFKKLVNAYVQCKSRFSTQQSINKSFNLKVQEINKKTDKE